MKSFFLGVLATVAVFALTSFAIYRATAPGESVAVVKRPTSIPLSQLPMERAFRTPISFGDRIQTVTLAKSAGAGVAITEIRSSAAAPGTNGGGDLWISVNGRSELFAFPPSGYGNQLHNAGASTHHLNPPLMARPGDVVTLTGCANTFVVAGYTILPGEA